MKVACVVLLLALTSSSLGAPRDNMLRRLEEWTVKYGRRYSSHGVHNNMVDTGLSLEANHLADGRLSGQSPPLVVSLGNELPSAPPKAFDWRSKGVISPVSNQGELASAIAIAAEECVASLQAIKTGELLELSSQEIQDCCSMPVTEVFDCIHNFGGVCSRSTYPVVTGNCRNNSCRAEVQIQGGKSVPASQADKMVDDLLQRPLLALIDASKSSFAEYSGGIYSDADCSKTEVDHAVQVVGYGEEDGQQFWICKNSWGETWGENGYVRVLRGSDTCGIESHASYPY
ncbi:uncharacterized protein [Haliotis asinina]|uniref:uncharacterized protein n=1 Tax=Haliotis asinina TaxID=109174 RepID=UPI003531F92A